MKIKEIHSSELTASCMRYVQLRFEGKTKPSATSALYRGLVIGEALRYLHERYLHHPTNEPVLFTPIVSEAVTSVRKTLAKEGRVLSDAAERDTPTMVSELGELIESYYNKFHPRFSDYTFLGCEVPVRWKFAPRNPEFASHIDLLMRDRNGHLVFIDWKLRETAPTWHYLSRNMQFAAYYACGLEGRFLLSDGLTSEWTRFGEESRGVWLHCGHLAPFGRKTSCEDDHGMMHEYQRGDQRPNRMAWREVEYAHTTAIEDIRSELMMRAKMIKNDIFPTNPDPIGCSLCEAEAFCRRFDLVI